jgi:hypothetical protein
MDDENTKDRYSAVVKPNECPNCGKKTVVPIAYGLPSEATFKKVNKGKFMLGGCCITDDDPAWGCKSCGISIYRERQKAGDGTPSGPRKYSSPCTRLIKAVRTLIDKCRF